MASEVTYRGAPPHVIAEVLRLRDTNGGSITERLLVDQARLLINRVKVHILEGEDIRIMPAFVSVTDGGGKRVRIGSERAVADPGLLGQVMAETRTQIRGLRNRLSAFDDAKHVVAQLDEVLDALPPT